MLPQRLHCRILAPGRDSGHRREPAAREAGFILLAVWALLLLLASPLRGQTGASLQVAAQVVSTEPSRSALALTAQALTTPGSARRQTRLAQVSVAPVRRDVLEPRRVRVDFLRN